MPKTLEALLGAVEMHQNAEALLCPSQAESGTRPTVSRAKGLQTRGEIAGVKPTRHRRPQVDGDQRAVLSVAPGRTLPGIAQPERS
jgi:hypothetical protein